MRAPVLPHRERGQAIVEFALILPLFVFLLCGLVQFGLVVNAALTVNDAAREGAREAAVWIARDPAGWQQLVADDVATNLQGGGLQTAPANYNPQPPYLTGDLIESYDPGTNTVSVQVTYRYPDWVPLLPALLGQSPWDPQFVLKSTVTFLVE